MVFQHVTTGKDQSVTVYNWNEIFLIGTKFDLLSSKVNVLKIVLCDSNFVILRTNTAKCGLNKFTPRVRREVYHKCLKM